MPTPEKELWPGWETVRMIGRGSFGTVYEIERDVFGHKEKAALKDITIPQSDSDVEELYDSGYDEASVTATFKSHLESIVNEYSLMREMAGSANVVNCDDFRIVPHDDSIGWDIFIKMELLTPLTKALDRQPEDAQVIQIARDMCSALALCGKHGIVHRDIKPQNVFISKNGDYKLGDFGIAKTIEKTSGGTKIGTYKYMAPEVYNNQPYNHTADIYSLGLVLHWMLNERRSPFMPLPPAPAVATQEDEARLRRFRGDPLPPPAHGSDELKRIVLKACAFDPKDRYQSAEEMLQDLNALNCATPEMPVFSVKQSAKSESEYTVGVYSPSREAPQKADETIGMFGKVTEPEVPSVLDGTIGVFDNPPSLPEPKPKKRVNPLILGCSVLAFLLIASVVFLLSGRKDTASPAAAESTSTPVATGSSTKWKDEAVNYQLVEGDTLVVKGSGEIKLLGAVITGWDEELKEQVKSVRIEEGITAIGDAAFAQCTQLTTVTIPKSVQSIGRFSFGQCSSLAEVYYLGSKTAWNSIEQSINAFPDRTHVQFGEEEAVEKVQIWTDADIVYSLAEGTLTISGNGETARLRDVIPDWETVRSKINTIVIEDGITSIGRASFARCDVQSVTLPSSVTSIGNSAFYGCTMLKSITIPTSVTSIDDTAFLDLYPNYVNVYYTGTEEQWNKIGGRGLESQTIHFNSK